MRSTGPLSFTHVMSAGLPSMSPRALCMPFSAISARKPCMPLSAPRFDTMRFRAPSRAPRSSTSAASRFRSSSASLVTNSSRRSWARHVGKRRCGHYTEAVYGWDIRHRHRPESPTYLPETKEAWGSSPCRPPFPRRQPALQYCNADALHGNDKVPYDLIARVRRRRGARWSCREGLHGSTNLGLRAGGPTRAQPATAEKPAWPAPSRWRGGWRERGEPAACAGPPSA